MLITKRLVLGFVVLTCGIVMTGCESESMTVSNLRCEYMDNPLGIDNLRPQLSWVLESDQHDQRQSSYRILVASDEARLGGDIGDLWDSGKVNSDDETGVVYGGKSLTSGAECFWKVMVWDKDDKQGKWSKAAKWSMGPLDAADWKGAWIGFDKPRVDAEKIFKEKEKAKAKNARLLPAASFLRKEFRVAKPVKQAMLYASALGNYEIHINGQRVGNDYFTPGWTDYNKRVYYNTYDVTGMIKRGANAIGGILAEG